MINIKKKLLPVLCAGLMMSGFIVPQKQAECCNRSIAVGTIIGASFVLLVATAILAPNNITVDISSTVDRVGYPEGDYVDSYGTHWWWDGYRYTHWWNGRRWVRYY